MTGFECDDSETQTAARARSCRRWSRRHTSVETRRRPTSAGVATPLDADANFFDGRAIVFNESRWRRSPQTCESTFWCYLDCVIIMLLSIVQSNIFRIDVITRSNVFSMFAHDHHSCLHATASTSARACKTRARSLIVAAHDGRDHDDDAAASTSRGAHASCCCTLSTRVHTRQPASERGRLVSR